MANFNTYQTRHFYVAKKKESALGSVDEAGDIYVGTTSNEQNGKVLDLYFSYMNADGLLTRSDLIKPENVVSLKKTAAAAMDIPLMMYTIGVDTNVLSFGANSNGIGKAITLTVNLRQFISYDSSDSIPVTASIVGNATNLASAAAFNKAIAKALVSARPKLVDVPFKIFIGTTEITPELAESSYPGSGNLVVVQAAGKYVRGKLSKEALELTFSSRLHGAVDDEAWATITPAKSTITNNTVIPSVYALADLEYFALGERGDVYRGSVWPNNYEPTYAIDLSSTYDVVTIEYFWQGTAENVQKSPRMIQIAAPAAVATSLFEAVDAVVNPQPSKGE